MFKCSALAAAVLLLAAPGSAFTYSKTGAVQVVTGKTFNQKVLQSNHTSIVEFYAPWCGHCKNLKPIYEKTADNLKGIANVVAIDCDEEINKRFCGEQGVQGFPTLKTYRPSAKRGGKPSIEDYNGPRTAQGMVDWVIERVPNHVTRLTATKLDDFLSKKNETAKVILFTNKGTTSALYKALAVDFLDSVTFAQIRDKEKEAVDKFGVTKFPTLILLPGGEKDGIVYDGAMKKDELVKFVSQVAEPNKGNPTGKKTSAKAKPQAKPDDTSSSSSSVESSEKPRSTFDATIPDISDMALFAQTCLSPKSKTCILVITPRVAPSLIPFEELNRYLHNVNPRGFPFFQIPQSILTAKVKDALDINSSEDAPTEVRAVNGKREWFVKFEGDSSSAEALQTWADTIRMGEAKKQRLPTKEEPLVGEEHDEL